MKSWWFRMKPRSVIRTIEWFPSFAMLEGQNWNEIDKKNVSRYNNRSINITRREYIYNAHSEGLDINYEEFMSGIHDTNEVESAARNDKISFEFFGFGYVDDDNIVRVTDTGRLIIDKKMNDEYLLKQLLKIQFPSPIVRKTCKTGHIFAMEVLLKAFKEFEYLTQLEVGLLFGCMNIENIDITINAIKEFRRNYNKLENKLKLKDVREIYNKVLIKAYPDIDNRPETYEDYADALIRAVTYTNLFLIRGRGIYKKLYIPKHSETKVRLLQEQYKFIYNSETDLDLFMKDFGNPYNIILPWDNVNNRKEIVESKLKSYEYIVEEAIQLDEELVIQDLPEIKKLMGNGSYKDLVIADERLSQSLLSINEKIFIQSTSKTPEVREEILEKFEDIDSGNEDMAALWLEVNTWKSLVAIKGRHRVKRNFKLEEDLTPRSFAPGIGNTPDMEVYVNGTILITEVSLMSGVRQWEHEGSAVIDHVLKFIEKYEDKNVYGIFISKAMNIRTIWQFFILNKESWVGKSVPIIPITIKQYIDIMSFTYENEVDINGLVKLISDISKNTLELDTYATWGESISNLIKKWKKKNVKK